MPTRLSVAAASCFCSVFAIVAHPAHANEQSPVLVDFRSSFVCLGCSFLLLALRWWRVWGESGRWKWKVLVECAHAPICCGCYAFLFIFRNRRALSPCHTGSPQSGSVFDRRLCVSGALFFFWWGAGGVFRENLVVGDGRCLSSVPTRLFVVAVACFCSDLSQSPRNVPVPMSAPNPGRCSIVVSVSRVLFSSSGGALVARFGEIWSLETEDAYRVCPRLFVVAVACCCLLQLSCNLPVPMSAPNPGRFSIVVSVSRMHFSSSGGLFGKCGFRRTSFLIIVIICDRAVVCWRCRLLCSLFCDCTCAVPDPVISPHSSSLSVGL